MRSWNSLELTPTNIRAIKRFILDPHFYARCRGSGFLCAHYTPGVELRKNALTLGALSASKQAERAILPAQRVLLRYTRKGRPKAALSWSVTFRPPLSAMLGRLGTMLNSGADGSITFLPFLHVCTRVLWSWAACWGYARCLSAARGEYQCEQAYNRRHRGPAPDTAPAAHAKRHTHTPPVNIK
jgi:hypothetical protein